MCVGRLPPSCRGILYGLEHHQDRGGHPAPLCSCPVASDGCGDGCGNIPVCSPHARKMFCLVLPIEPRNVRSLQQPVSAARHQGDKKPAMCPRVLSPPSLAGLRLCCRPGRDPLSWGRAPSNSCFWKDKTQPFKATTKIQN